MGLFFNTPDTIAIVNILNARFGEGAIDRLRVEAPAFNRLTLRTLAEDLGIHPPDRQVRWFKYLEKLQGRVQTVMRKGRKVNMNVEILLRNQIKKGLKDGNCREIIFVALPGATVELTWTNFEHPRLPNDPPHYSKIVTITTLTHDRLP